MVNLLVWIIFGLFVGAIARLIVPGRDPMGCLGTILLGIAGSVMGGFLGSLFFGGFQGEFRPAGFLGAIIGGVIVLLIWRQFRRRPL